jgi:hypothetical protein
VAISGMEVDPLRFLDMPILARLTLVEGAIHDIKLPKGDWIEAYVRDEIAPSSSLCSPPLPS